MILTHLSLQNFKNFQAKDIDLSPGINVLQGPNGSGKTSVLEAIEFGLYGTVAGRAGLEPLVRLGESVASVSLSFTVQEDSQPRNLAVSRQISKGQTGASTAATRLTKDGVEVSNRKAKVDEEILKAVGLSHSSYSNSCYIRQGEIRALLEAGKEREREIDRMIGFGVFEDAWKDLRKAESDLEREVASAKEELIRAKAELENLLSVSSELSERMEEKIRIEGEIREAEKKLGALAVTEAVAGQAGDLIQLERSKAAQAQKVQNLRDQELQLEQKIDSFNDKLLEMEAELRRRENRIDSLRDEHKALLDRISKVDEEITRGRAALQELESEILRLEAELESQKSLITSFAQMEAKGQTVCPICGSELVPEHARETRRALDVRVRELQEAIEKRRTDLRRFEQSDEASKSRAARLRAQLEELGKEISDAEAQNSGVKVTKEEIEAELGSYVQQKRELEKNVESETKLLQDLEKTIPSTAGPDQALAEAKGRYLANKQILQRLEKEIPVLMERLAEQQMKKAGLKAAEEKHSRLSRELETLRDVRWAFNNIGPYARKKILPSVSDQTRALFSSIYSGGTIRRIELTPDYDVQAETASGAGLSSRALSVGERVVAGLALRIALSHVGQRMPGAEAQEPQAQRAPSFLILDEPTEYLDEANVRALARTIAGLKTVGQIVIVTHDRELMEEIGHQSQINRIVLAAGSKT